MSKKKTLDLIYQNGETETIRRDVYCVCAKCSGYMVGILSYKAREVCYECQSQESTAA